MSLSQTGTFVETIIDLVDGATRANIIGFSSNNKLVLNGRGGADGGSGIPWGGLVGCLIQRRVCFDSTEAATPCILPSSSLLDNLNRMRWRHKPATWFEMTPTDPRSMQVHVASGLWYKDEADYVDFTGGNSPIITSPIADPRVDVVYLTASGIVAVSEGIESVSPTFTIPSGTILPIGTVYVTPVACGIGWPCDTDLYSGSLYSGYIYKDLRPFVTYPGGGGGDSYWSDGGAYLYPTDTRSIKLEDSQWIGNSAASARLHFDSSGVLNLAYFSDCNVGVNAAIPTRRLEVHTQDANVAWAANADQEALFFRNTIDADNNWAFLTFGGSGGNVAAWIGAQFIDSGNDYSTISFGTRGAGGAGQRVRIESGGDTRISTAQKLYPEDASGQDLGDATHLWDLFASYVDLPNGGWIGNAAGDMRITFYSANFIEITTDTLNIYTIDEDPSAATPMGISAANINITGGDNTIGDDAGLWLRNEYTNIDWSIFVDADDSDHLKIARENTEVAEFDTVGNFRMFSGNDIDPEDATGQDLGSSAHRWDLYANDINMDNAGVIHCTTLGGPIITFDSISDYLEITECRVSIGHATPIVALDINTPTWNHNGILLGSGGPPANLGMVKFTGLDFFGFTPSGWLSLTASGTGGGGGASLWTDHGAYIEPTNPNDVRIGTGQDFYPEDATGQDLGRGGNRWDVYARRINLPDTGWIGILGNEVLTVNAGGTFAFTGITGITVEDGDWVGCGAADVRIAFHAGSNIETIGDIEVATGNNITPADAAGQDLGDATHLWDVFASYIDLPDTGWIGIAGNETLTANAAGNFTFSAAVTSIVVNDGTWIGADAACSWLFDSTNGDVTTLDKVGIGTTNPGVYLLHVLSATDHAYAKFESNANNKQVLLFVDRNNANNWAGFAFQTAGFGKWLVGLNGATENLQFYDDVTNAVALLVEIGGRTTITRSAVASAADANATLIVERDSWNFIQFKSGSAQESGFLFGDVGDINEGRIIYDHNDNHMELWTNNAECITILSSSNVGIGITPTKKLSVNGSIDTSTALGIRAYRSTTQTIVTDTWTALDWDTQVYDTDAGFAPTSTIMYSKSAGYYIAGGGCTFSTTSLNGEIRVIKNGTTVLARASFTLALSNTRMNICTGMIYLAVNDYIEIEVYHSRGSDALISAANSSTHNNNYGFLVRTA